MFRKFLSVLFSILLLGSAESATAASKWYLATADLKICSFSGSRHEHFCMYQYRLYNNGRSVQGIYGNIYGKTSRGEVYGGFKATDTGDRICGESAINEYINPGDYHEGTFCLKVPGNKKLISIYIANSPVSSSKIAQKVSYVTRPGEFGY